MKTMIRIFAATFALSACAPATTRNPALVFTGRAVPECPFEVVGQISVEESVTGDRRTAEEALHRALARAAERREAHGVIGVDIKSPERLPVVVADGRRPSDADRPPVTWTATAQAIRFTDQSCRK